MKQKKHISYIVYVFDKSYIIYHIHFNKPKKPINSLKDWIGNRIQCAALIKVFQDFQRFFNISFFNFNIWNK